MNLEVTKTRTVNAETKKEFCNIYKVETEVLYINGLRVASIRPIIDRHDRNHLGAGATHNFNVSFTPHAEGFKIFSHYGGNIRTKKRFFQLIEMALTQYVDSL